MVETRTSQSSRSRRRTGSVAQATDEAPDSVMIEGDDVNEGSDRYEEIKRSELHIDTPVSYTNLTLPTIYSV